MAGVVVAAPSGSRVAVRIEISADFNVTAVTARQKANRYLLMNLGDQLHAGEPELMIGERLWWRVPVLLSLSQGGYLGKVGELQVDAQSGAVEPALETSLAQIADYADMLYERATQGAGTSE
jgi:hypothetical protein